MNHASVAQGHVTAEPLFWGDDEAHARLKPPFDVILLADVVYEPEGYSPLIASMKALSSAETVTLMAYRHRHPDDHKFFTELDQHFVVEEQGACTDGAAFEFRSEYSADVKILRTRLKS